MVGVRVRVGGWGRRVRLRVGIRRRDRVRAVGRPGSLSPQTRAARGRPAHWVRFRDRVMVRLRSVLGI